MTNNDTLVMTEIIISFEGFVKYWMEIIQVVVLQPSKELLII